VVNGVLGFLGGFGGIGERNNSVEAESVRIRAAMGSGHFIHQASEGDRRELLAREDIGTWNREGDDRAFDALRGHEAELSCHVPFGDWVAANIWVESPVPVWCNMS